MHPPAKTSCLATAPGVFGTVWLCGVCVAVWCVCCLFGATKLVCHDLFGGCVVFVACFVGVSRQKTCTERPTSQRLPHCHTLYPHHAYYSITLALTQVTQLHCNPWTSLLSTAAATAGVRPAHTSTSHNAWWQSSSSSRSRTLGPKWGRQRQQQQQEEEVQQHSRRQVSLLSSSSSSRLVESRDRMLQQRKPQRQRQRPEKLPGLQLLVAV